MGLSPTQRALARLKADGFEYVAIVERWNSHARIRQDLFGFIDILAIEPGKGMLAIQATASYSNVSKRVKKIKEECNEAAQAWLSVPGNRIEVWGWRQLLIKRGSKAKKWEPIIRVITLEDLKTAEITVSEATTA